MTLKAPLFQKTTLASCLLVSYFVSFFVPRVSGSAWIGSDTLWKQALTPACASPHIPSISYSTINQTTALQMHGTSPSSPPQPQGTPAVAPQAQPSQKMCHHQVPRANQGGKATPQEGGSSPLQHLSATAQRLPFCWLPPLPAEKCKLHRGSLQRCGWPGSPPTPEKRPPLPCRRFWRPEDMQGLI